LGDKLKKLKNQELRARVKRDTEPDFDVTFYSLDGKKVSEIGHFGFWQIVHDEMYLKVEGKPGGHFGFPHAECMAFAKEIRPVLCNIDNALEALDVPDPYLKKAAMQAVTQRCFFDKAKEVLPKLEAFLSDKDEKTREFAAHRILRIAPTHPEANKVWDMRKK